MSKIVNYMRELGLVSLDKIKQYFSATDIDTLLSFDEYIGQLASEDWKISEYSPYSFAPSMDVSGFGGCSEINCKMRRANKFIKFSSLYSDCIYLIVDSITNPHAEDITGENVDYYRDELIRDYSLIHLYADLLSEGIARIIPSHFSLCPDCFSKHICDRSDLDALKPLVEEYAAKVDMVATEYFSQQNTSIIRLSNLPELFPDHDGLFVLQGGLISDYCKSCSTFPHAISDRKLIQDFIENQLFDELFTTRFEAFISSSYQSKYITAKVSGRALIESNSVKTIGTSSPPVFEMPFLENISPKRILDLRKSEYDAFNEYRIAIDQASKSYLASSSSAEYRDIYDDIIYPSFIKLDAMLKRAKRMHKIKNFCELAIVSSSVTLGLMTSVIPKDPISVASAIGGSELLVSQLGNIVERKLSSGNELEQQDFYFLWKLKNR